MQGKVKIQLTDVNTGKKVEREEHNIVTNAVAELMQCCTTANEAINTRVTPIATKALGGLMLFDGTLNENATETDFPNYVHFIANAGQWTSSSTKEGSLIANESGTITNGYRSVWSFNTSQGNGTIASLARTYNVSPFWSSAYECNHTPKKNGSNYGTTFIYNESDECFYFYEVTNNTNLNIYKQRQSMTKYKVTDYAAKRENEPELVVTRTVESMGTNKWEKNNDGYLYCAYCGGNTSGDCTFSYQKVKYSDYTFTVSEKITITLTNKQVLAQEVAISGTKAFLVGNNQRYAYLVDLTNTANIITIDAGENNYFLAPYYSSQKSVFGNGNGIFRTTIEHLTGEANYKRNCYAAIIYGDGTIRERLWKSGSGSISGYGIYFSRSRIYKQMDTGYHGFNYQSYINRKVDITYSSNIMLVTDYLGTICNLATPIVKTNTQTMKITYDLIDV